MGNMYMTIERLCRQRGVSITEMCRESGASRGSLTDLKMGRIERLNHETVIRIADYFGVSMDELYGREPAEKAISDDDLKFALFGGEGEITDEMFAEVKAFAEFVKMKNKKGKRD